jgi:hypothetical protein
MIMDRLYGGVCYAGIDTDPELKYPKVTPTVCSMLSLLLNSYIPWANNLLSLIQSLLCVILILVSVDLKIRIFLT